MDDQDNREQEVKKRSKRGVGRPRQVSIDQIMDMVMQIGLENLTLQALASALNITPSALYRHVKSKGDLESRFVDRVTTIYPVADYTGESWHEWVRKFALSLYDMYQSVPGLADFSQKRTIATSSVLARHEQAIRAAKTAGFSDVEAFYASRAVIEFVSGWVARTQRREAVQREEGVHPDDHFFDLAIDDPAARFENLKTALIAVRQDPPDRRFFYTLDALIAGLYETRSRSTAALSKMS